MRRATAIGLAIGMIAVSTMPTLAAVRAALCEAIIVDTKLDKVTFRDACGNTWSWFDADDINPGEFYSVCFDTRETASIEDDEIINIHYEHLASWK